MSGGLVAAGVGLVLVTAVLVVILEGFQHRRLARRLRRVADRLAPNAEKGRFRSSIGLASAVERIESAALATEARLGEHSVVAEHLAFGLDAIPQGVVIADNSGEVVFRNRIAAGFEAGRHGDALIAKATEDLLGEALAGSPGRRNLDLFGPPRRSLVIAADRLGDGHQTTGALAVIDDVTERRRIDSVRRDFVANISHELKTPVGALALLAETLATEEDPEVARRLARRVLSESERVAHTIDDLLELSRIEAQEAPVRDPVPVHLVVAEAVERVRSAAEQRQIRIEVAEASPRLSVLGDRRQLVSALANLLDNAVKYSDECSEVEVRISTDGSMVDLGVTDHGIGIPARDLERIFERFYRVDRARSRETGGTGLGLAIVRHVMNNHEGEVRVMSHEGEGSTFSLRVPAGPGPVAVTAPPDHAARAG